MNNIKIYVIRHAQSEINARNDQIGQQSTTPLTELGRQQATLLGKRFIDNKIKFDKVFASTYTRAIDTAKIATNIDNRGGEIHYDPRLIEYNPGDWVGRKRSEVYADPKNVMAVANLQMGFQFPNGDTLHQVERKVSTFVEEEIIYNKEILALAEERNVNIAIFSHGITIKCLLYYILGFNPIYIWNLHIYNTGLSLLYYNDRGWLVKSINDTGHLL